MFSVRPGDVLAGKYRVERVLGSGGMGYVVAARHLQLDQLVALKLLRRDNPGIDEAEATSRFLREAKAVVRLRNEHIAKVFDVGTLETGEPFIVMEYLDGCDLSALAKQRGQLPVSEAVEYVLQACEALGEAHSLGIVHRDVKLANLFVTQGHAGSALVKVLDFGISKVNPFGATGSDQDMTRSASMLGSPRFMSPEQMRDPRAVDARSDLWSLGIVLYRLVAGVAPFEGDTLGRLLSMVMHENPALLSAVRGDLPSGFSELVQRCMEKQPDARFANVAELAYGLVPFAVDPLRARGIADRIAQTLGVAQIVHGATIAGPRMGVGAAAPSGAPGAHDSGTAAPWAGTQGALRPSERPRTGIAWGAVVVAAMCTAAVVIQTVRREQAAVGSRGTQPIASVMATQAPPTQPRWAAPEAAASAASPALAKTAWSASTEPSADAEPLASETRDNSKAGDPAPKASAKPRRKAVRTTGPSAASSAEIPSTRD